VQKGGGLGGGVLLRCITVEVLRRGARSRGSACADSGDASFHYRVHNFEDEGAHVALRRPWQTTFGTLSVSSNRCHWCFSAFIETFCHSSCCQCF